LQQDESIDKIDTGIIVDEKIINGFIKCDGVKISDDEWKENFNDWKYKLRLGNEVYLSSEDIPIKLKKGEFVVIKPGDFALLLTKEQIEVPLNVMAFISMRFDYKEKGLINVSGFHVDPGYKGRLIFSAFNAGPNDIIIREGDKVFMIFFQKLPSKVGYRKEDGYTYIPTNMIAGIRGKSVTLASNANRMERLEFNFKILGGFVIAIMTALLTLLIKELLKP